MMKGFMEEKSRYDAVFQLVKKDFPELRDAKVIITDRSDDVTIGVTALVRVINREEDKFLVKNEQIGDYCVVSKIEPITKLFDALRDMLERVSAAADEYQTGVKA